MKDTTPTDFFYNIEDIRNLFKDFTQERYYKNYRLAKTFPVWTGECASKLVFYKRWDELNNIE